MINRLKPKSEFSKNVLTLMTGTTIAQAIPIAISPILTRIYTPGDFGVFALFVALVSIFGSIANGSYEYAIMLPKKDEDAINIFALGFIINVSLAVFLLLIVTIFNKQIVVLLGNNEISIWLYFIPFVVFLVGLFNLLNYFNNRLKNYKNLAKANIYKSIANVIVQLGFGFLKAGALGLISGQIVSQIVSNTKLFLNIKKLNLFKKISKIKIIALGKKYKKFPLFSLPNVILDGIREQGFNILLPIFFSIATLGQFYLAQRMLKMPISIIGGSISQVFFQKISISKSYQLYELYISFIKKSIMISTPIFVLIYFLSIDIFTFVFGDNWKFAGEIASLLSPWMFLSFITSPLANIFIILQKQEIVLIYAIMYAIIPISLILSENDFITIVKLLSFLMTILLMLFLIHIHIILSKLRKNNVV
jgi:O-antigen/teichoic acid export membrane protein